MPEPRRAAPTSLLLWWPVLLTAVAVGSSAVRADTKISDTEARVEYLYSKGSPIVAERLARIEAGQDATLRQLDRIEKKLDSE